ncbi:MAG: class I SAM-dependent methyltransferase [Actinobacteria bacterium]|nr:class I SAM-dependent methyltransferase [Actinomycetota bacterium]
MSSEEYPSKPISDSIPRFLIKYSSYGSIVNQIPPNSKVLDVGCGDGRISALFKRKDCDVWGVDVSRRAVELASKNGIKVKQWDLNQVPLPFEEASFNVLTLIDVLEHVIDPLALLKEAHRLLAPGGRLIISLPNFARIGNRLRMFIGDPRDILHWEGYGDEIEHLHWFTLPKLRYFLKKANFKKISAQPVGLPFGFIFGLLRLYGLSKILLVVVVKGENVV